MRSESSAEWTGCLSLELTAQIDSKVSESRARHDVKKNREILILNDNRTLGL